MSTKNLSTYAPIILRLALTGVFVWFGTSQLANPAAWASLVPSFATALSGMDATTIVRLNGLIEIFLGAHLAVGIYVRWVALALSLHLFVITMNLGNTAIGVRDLGLTFATLALAFLGEDKWCLRYKQEKTVV
jgi:uncharacterized membrane protein YphA (DoxX/SURF4 family)